MIPFEDVLEIVEAHLYGAQIATGYGAYGACTAGRLTVGRWVDGLCPDPFILTAAEWLGISLGYWSSFDEAGRAVGDEDQGVLEQLVAELIGLTPH